jgi:uncharacterized protein DUF5662
MPELTEKEKATNYETIRHIRQVQAALNKIIILLLERGRVHDKSKLEEPELKHFAEHTHRLKDLKYGSEEWAQNMKNIAPALEHHWAHNRHHPQYHKKGINGMNIIDLAEMLADWSASTKRTKDGNLRESLMINKGRFKIQQQLFDILENSIELFEDDN